MGAEMNTITHYDKAVTVVRYKVVVEIHDLVLKELETGLKTLALAQAKLREGKRLTGVNARQVSDLVSKAEVPLARLLDGIEVHLDG